MNRISTLNKMALSAMLLASGVFSTVVHAAAGAYPEFVEKLHAYHVSRKEFDTKFYSAIQQVSEALKGEPDADKIKSTAEEAVKAFDGAKRALVTLSDFLRKNISGFGASASVVGQINKDRAELDSGKISDMVSSLKSFGDALKVSDLTVYGTDGWANSEIAVNRGDRVVVRTTGSWSGSPSMQHTDGRGYICNAGSAYLVSQAAPLGALIFRIRGSQDPNGRGLTHDGRGVADAKGRLEFMINDSDRHNNSGQLNLNVVVLDGDATKKIFESFGQKRETE